MSEETLPHSGLYFGDERNYWWNFDFLALMAIRWDLKNCHTVLDVGCGVGHWGHILAPHLSSDFQIYGIDPEPEWVEKSTAKAQQRRLEDRFHYQVGTAEQIPFEDNSFDMVTCQTVLIHVADIAVALKEMKRVLKPGGLLAVAEPNNIAPYLVFDNLNVDDPLEPRFESIRFELMCQRGKKALGLGYNSAGDLLPFYFQQQSLKDIQLYLSDKVSLMIPPYETEEQQVLARRLISSSSSQLLEFLTWPEEETKRYFLAGGGTIPEFEQQWTNMVEGLHAYQQSIKDQTVFSPGTCIMYLMSGRK